MIPMKLRLFFGTVVLFSVLNTIASESTNVYDGYGPENVTQHSGYITVNGTDVDGAHLFYWMFESRSDPQNDPFVIWLTGGPGCSSMLALLVENGPYYLDINDNLQINPYSWNSNANILFVDQPVGSGFSYSEHIYDFVRNEDQVAADLYTFLQKFFAQFPQYRSLNFYVTGESYAGHYVPAIGHKIMIENQNPANPTINLKGLAIGNGWVWPRVQYGAYAEFAYGNGLIGEASYKLWNGTYWACRKLIDSGGWFAALEECSLMMEGILLEMSISLGYYPNEYDIRIPCAELPLCYNFDNQTQFFNDPEVQQALGVKPGMEWESCNQEVHTLMLGDWIDNLEAIIPAVLEGGVEVLVYSGTEDYICNWMGGRDWTNAMEWKGQQEFLNAKEVDWNVDGHKAGVSRSAQGLTFLQVFEAGHMVPMDQPAAALDMLGRFLTSKPFN